ncbi:MAG TPA: acyltransferase [Methanotrichaceae archaeon]|nr:acyltransferase [Methanotrichaceae archaeon]
MLRAIGIFLVVVSHLPYFIESESLSRLAPLLAVLGLSLFFFVSGYAIHTNAPQLNCSRDALIFFKRRLIRVYPLFLLASAVWIIIRYFEMGPSLLVKYFSVDYLVYLLNLAYILQPRFGFGTDYWFIGAILLCYVIYILLGMSHKSSRDLLLRSIAVTALLLACRAAFNILSSRVLTFSCIFILGVLAAEAGIFRRRWIMAAGIIGFAVTLSLFIQSFGIVFPDDQILSMGSTGYVLAYYSNVLVLMFSFCVLSYRAVQLLAMRGLVFGILSGIGYGAYSTYLFHTALLKLMALALAAVGIPHPAYGLCLVVVGVPLSLLSGYCIQRGEARYTRHARSGKICDDMGPISNSGT